MHILDLQKTNACFQNDNGIDTITKFTIPLTYIVPQIQNSTGNIISDTLNWTLVTGTFVANGNEKHCVIGNFKSDANTNKVLINTTNLPFIFADCAIDDVSCIPLDLPAYAGADAWAIPGTTLYIGRQQDVGIDEACTWYNLTNTTTPIANAAGFSLTVSAITTTYIVKQDICGIIKYDTVVVHASALGIGSMSGVEAGFKVYPNPANDVLNIEISDAELSRSGSLKLQITNNLGLLIREEEVVLKNGTAQLNIKELESGVYVLKVASTMLSHQGISKRFVVAR